MVENEGIGRSPEQHWAQLDTHARVQTKVAMELQEQRYQYLLEAVDVPIWEKDFSAVKVEIEQLRASGVKDFPQYFAEHPGFVAQIMDRVRVVNVNQAAVQLFEAKSREELLTSFNQVLLSETISVFMGELLTLAAQETSFSAETVLQTLQGNRLTISFALTFPPSEELYDRVIVRAVDISKQQAPQGDRQPSETVLAQRESRLRDLVESIDEVFYINAPSTPQTLYVSPAYEKVWGRTGESLYQNPNFWLEAIHPNDVERVSAAHIGNLQGEPFQAEYRILRPDGEIRWVLDRGFQVRDQAEQLLHRIGVATDITERKLAEVELRDMSHVLNPIVEGIAWLDPDGCYRTINPAYAQIIGYQPEDLIGTSWQQTIHPEDLEKLMVACQQMLKNHQAEVETRGIKKDGSSFYSHFTLVAAYDDHRQLTGFYCFIKDISENKRLEVQLFHSQRLESLGNLASGIAHELNNLLTPVLTIVQLLPLQVPNIDARMQGLLQAAETNIQRGTALLKRMLMFSRSAEEEYKVLHVQSLFAEIEALIADLFPKSIDLYTHVQPGLSAVKADATQLHQVLLNLCLNARDAMPGGGRLRLSAKNVFLNEQDARRNPSARVGNYVLITVSDTGVGIPPELLDRILDPVFTVKGQAEGMGLGLTTVANIVKNHGGFVDVFSEVIGGSQFKVFLPATESLEIAKKTAPELPKGNGELILVVDDDVTVSEATKTILETYGYRMLMASGGLEAIELYAQNQNEIGAILMDLMMPSIDGVMTSRTLGKMNPQVKIVVVSGLIPTEQLGIEAGKIVKAFLSKPYTAEDLLKTLAKVLRET
ncbi:MAG: PAS domain-containing hybrid sensor histidine kinase/response regulator [Microcoleaceae cyanobacterium]